jgi:ATP-dependent helicase HrpB
VPTPLPIDAHLPAIAAALRDAPCLVLRAPPGAGKTTRVPAALLDHGLAGDGQVWVLQPRRVAARTTAARIAEERGGRLGEEIGYQIRFERRTSARTRLVVMTEGVLVRRLLDDPFLDRVGVVVLDEFHERHLETDLALAMVRRVQQTVRPDLKLVVMSATLSTAALTEYLAPCPVIDCMVRTHPVEIE